MVKNALVRLLDRMGYRLQKKDDLSESDMFSERSFMQVYEQSRAYTMTSKERMFALYQAVQYVHANRIDGAFVECGVWKAGSSMLAASTLLTLGDSTREMYLYDTFEGMSEPEDIDISARGDVVKNNWDEVSQDEKLFCYSSLDEVKSNFFQVGYPQDKTYFVKGKVEDTIPKTIPGKIAILRLDTDWFASTYHELVHLYPLLAPKGVLIIDDYGHWQGARKAVDTYFQEHNITPLLSRIDYTGRLCIKLP